VLVPQCVLHWLVDNADRALPWCELGWAIASRIFHDQAAGVDLVQAEATLILLEYPISVVKMVLMALLETNCDARAAALVSRHRPRPNSGSRFIESVLQPLNNHRHLSIQALNLKTLGSTHCWRSPFTKSPPAHAGPRVDRSCLSYEGFVDVDAWS
jgi:hypothetical protein